MPREPSGSDAGVSRAAFVYTHLRNGILSGLYRPGQRIREVHLAETLQTSRTPVREAIRRLEADRLIEDVQGRGLAIVALDEQRVRELYQFRAGLEASAAEITAGQVSEIDLANLREALEDMRAAADNPVVAARLNRRFHQAIYHAARNSFLANAIATMEVFMALLPGTTYQTPGRMSEVLGEHDAILDAIARRAPAEAAAAARAHIQQAGRFRLRMMFSA
ncbi:GntR family transcriptional regulator [Humitalea sp. 24SJ18S-53]|uniref:GntR family transcriptional regulator n=1 Tax=Humitalea sp. 24SJ18S-53 TaxID=3422307 RepID=UPI003D66FBF8